MKSKKRIFKNINDDIKDMKKEVYVKQFIGGFVVPALFLSILYTIFSFLGWLGAVTTWDFLISPVFFGFINVLYFKIKAVLPIKNPKVRYGFYGGLLWLIIPLVYIPIQLTSIQSHSKMAELMGPTINFNFHSTAFLYLPLVGYIWFAYVQKPLNDILGLKV